MHAQYGTLTWQKRKPFWRQCKSLLAKYAVRTGIWTIYKSMLVHLNIPSLQQRLQLKANMMYQFVHGVSYIPEDILLLHPPPTMTHAVVLISLFPMLEQMLIVIPSFHTLYISGTHLHLL